MQWDLPYLMGIAHSYIRFADPTDDHPEKKPAGVPIDVRLLEQH